MTSITDSQSDKGHTSRDEFILYLQNNLSSSAMEKNSLLHTMYPKLNDSEIILDSFSCALKKEILVHGRFYVTPSYFWFYSKILTFETTILKKWSDVEEITKEKIALFFPNSIEISVGRDRMFFASFISRDETFDIFVKLWSINTKTTSDSEWQVNVKEIFNNPDLDKSVTLNESPMNIEKKNKTIEGSARSLKYKKRFKKAKSYSPIKPIQDDDVLSDGESSKRFSLKKRLSVFFKMRSKDSTQEGDVFTAETASVQERMENIPIIEEKIINCTCPSLQLITFKETVSVNLNDTVNLLFGSESPVNQKFIRVKKFTNYSCDMKEYKDENNYTREIFYNLNLSWARKQIQSITTQVFTVEKKHAIVKCVTVSRDIPYGDSFETHTLYCLKEKGNSTEISASCEIVFIRDLWMMTRGIIEREVKSNVKDFIGTLLHLLKEHINGNSAELIVAESPEGNISTNISLAESGLQNQPKLSVNSQDIFEQSPFQWLNQSIFECFTYFYDQRILNLLVLVLLLYTLYRANKAINRADQVLLSVMDAVSKVVSNYNNTDSKS